MKVERKNNLVYIDCLIWHATEYLNIEQNYKHGDW
jgi:hypothetical protein